MELDLKHTIVFEKNLKAYNNSDIRFIVNEGGTSSSKTYSICQMLIFLAITELEEYIIDIGRKTLPSLKGTAMKDFFDILDGWNLYNPEHHNISENQYSIGTNLFSFFSLDHPKKVRGRRRHILWLNEANEFDLESYRQMNQRTKYKVIMDYNPSDEVHWIYDKVLDRKEAILIQSSYLDNPFLEDSIINEIENYKTEDIEYWTIYGLGKRALSPLKIYSNYDLINDMPGSLDETIYGLDFGFNNPSAFIRIGIKDKEYYLEELIHEPRLTNSKLIEKIDSFNINKNAEIYCDNAEPNRIQELKDAGYVNAKPADKSVKDGIDFVKRQRLHILKESYKTEKEFKRYKWKSDANGRILDEPVKIDDHSPDAVRYAIYTHSKVLIGYSTTEQAPPRERRSLTEQMGIKGIKFNRILNH